MLKENVATGRSWRRSVSDMRELLGVDYPGGATYAATRILRTETARVNNELSAEANVENGIDRYRYIAMLDSKTTEACRDHDGGIDPDTKKPYTYKNKKLGVNFPPLHPNCRSTTCAWVSEELLGKITRTARDENGNVYQIPGNMTYREWETWKGRDAMSRIPGKVGNFGKPKGRISAEDLAALDDHAKQAGIRLDSLAFSTFDGDVELIHEVIDDISTVVKDFPKKLFRRKPICLSVSYTAGDREADYAETNNRTILLN